MKSSYFQLSNDSNEISIKIQNKSCIYLCAAMTAMAATLNLITRHRLLLLLLFPCIVREWSLSAPAPFPGSIASICASSLAWCLNAFTLPICCSRMRLCAASCPSRVYTGSRAPLRRAQAARRDEFSVCRVARVVLSCDIWDSSSCLAEPSCRALPRASLARTFDFYLRTP